MGADEAVSPGSVPSAAAESGDESESCGGADKQRASPTPSGPDAADVAQRSTSPQHVAGEDPEDTAEEQDNDIVNVVHVAAEMLDLASLAQINAASSGAQQESGP